MRKLINDPDDFVNEFIDGLLTVHPEMQAITDDRRCIVRADRGDRVGIVTGGGSGHLPLFVGYVGAGLCSGAAIGNVFSSPSAQQILATTKAVDSGRGVLYLYGNYGGDVLNFDLAADLAEAEGIRVQTVLTHDDVMSRPADLAEERRGVAGTVLVYKCAGAAAERGDGLDDVARIARAAANNVLTAGVGLAPTIMPTTGKPSFDLDDGQMEVGIGIHGEPGRERVTLATADEVTTTLLAPINDELALDATSRVALLINGLGATPLEELYIIARAATAQIAKRGATIAHTWVGEFATSLEMAGASISVMRLDEDLESLLAAPSRSPVVSL